MVFNSTVGLEDEAENQDAGSCKSKSGAFARFPNAVARDERLDAAALVLLAYRSTFGDEIADFGLNETALLKRPIVKPGTGLGRNAIRGGISNAVDLGYLVRGQTGRSSGPGQWPMAVDRLNLPPCGKTGKAGQHIKRAWFDGNLSLKAMAAWLYISAGTGKGPRIYTREIAKRCGWSNPTASTAVNELIGLGLVQRVRERKANGRLAGVSYRRSESSFWAIWTTQKKPGDGLQGDAFPGHLRNSPLHELSLNREKEPVARSPKGGSYTSPLGEAVTLADVAFASPKLLGFEIEGDEVEQPSDEAVCQINEAVDDQSLRDRLLDATQRRIDPEILSPAGLYAVRHLAAIIHSAVKGTGDEATPAEALTFVLKQIRERVGRKGAWLNALSLVGKRIYADLRYGVLGELYGRRDAERLDDPIAKTLEDIRKADGARILAPSVLGDVDGLRRLMKCHPNADTAIQRVLCRAMIDGTGVGSVKTWNYFAGAIADEELGVSKPVRAGARGA
jgi:hypothetical protein